jgi:hypothetical protein
MVMLPLTKANNYTATVMICGGSVLLDNKVVSSADCYTITPDVPGSKWVKEDNMPVGRVMTDTAILPDGRIVYVNGAGWGTAGGQGGDTANAGDPVFEPVVFDPNAPTGRKWATWSKAKIARLYHSGVILTQSGHLITTGSEMQNYIDTQGPANATDRECFPFGAKKACTSPYEYRLERFTPPYLQTGKPRPVINGTNATLTYNSTFIVEYTHQKDLKIDRVTFVRYSTTTHSTNTDQRLVELEILATRPDKLYLRAPENGAIAPPGNWMLFLLSEGVPSEARTINLQGGPPTFVKIPTSGASPRTTMTGLSLAVALVFCLL